MADEQKTQKIQSAKNADQMKHDEEELSEEELESIAGGFTPLPQYKPQNVAQGKPSANIALDQD